MKIIELKPIERTYKNNGQHAEQVARFTLTGQICKADNKKFTAGGDVGDLQIKSNGATICDGTDLLKHIELDGANRYGFVYDNFTKMVILDVQEYIELVDYWGYIDKNSKTKTEKIRIRVSDKLLIQWIGVRI